MRVGKKRISTQQQSKSHRLPVNLFKNLFLQIKTGTYQHNKLHSLWLNCIKYHRAGMFGEEQKLSITRELEKVRRKEKCGKLCIV